MITVVFRSRLRDVNDAEYHALAPRMVELVESIPGFVSFRAYEAEDGERVAIGQFESLEAVEAWRTHSEHLAAQRLGQERFYSEYQLEVCETIRAYGFDGTTRTDSIGSTQDR